MDHGDHLKVQGLHVCNELELHHVVDVLAGSLVVGAAFFKITQYRGQNLLVGWHNDGR